MEPCKYDTELVWQLTGTNEQSGRVDILSMLRWWRTRVPAAGNGLWQIDFGFDLWARAG